MRIHRTIATLLAVIAVTLAFEAANVLAPLDRWLLDAEFRLLRQWFPIPAARQVVVVGVDEETTRRFPEPIALWHGHLGRFLAAMTQAKPSAVGIDIVLPDRSFDAVVPGLDKLLLKTMFDARGAYPLLLAVTVDPEGKPRSIYPPFVAAAGAQGWGYALFPIDGDGRVRRFDERLGANGERVPTLAGQMARQLGVEPRAGFLDYWRGAPFDYVPLHRVVKWLDDNDQRALAQAFGAKPVLLGIVLPFTDRQPVPAPLAAWEPGVTDTPGVLLHAHALRTMLDRGFIQAVPKPVVVAVVASTVLLWFVSGNAVVSVLLFCTVAVLFFTGAMWLTTQGWFFPVAAPIFAATLALGGRNAVDTVAKLRERRRLRGSFSGYVSPAVLDEILAGRVRPELGGTSAFVCVMFSDIRGYTARSEGMSPEQVIRFLNRYFEHVVAFIHAHGGSVMSFMGDGIMAVFGAPNALENPSREAFEAGRKMLQYVAELNEQFRNEGEAPIDIGIGLHAGEAVIGHVGSSTRHDYTAIGDVINVASRLEALTKEAGFRMVLSKTAQHLGGDESLKHLGAMAIKGHSPVEVYGYDASTP
jgi:class 3 adenylate cyclase